MMPIGFAHPACIDTAYETPANRFRENRSDWEPLRRFLATLSRHERQGYHAKNLPTLPTFAMRRRGLPPAARRAQYRTGSGSQQGPGFPHPNLLWP